MEKLSNHSKVTEIILSGFPSLEHFHILLFLVLLIIYLFIITGNVLIILVIQKMSSLQSPMYYFIAALLCLEICYTAVTIPKMLADLLDKQKKISFTGCLLQAYCLHALGAAECYILIIMAYDRYLAICTPLQYSSTMTTRLYLSLVIACFIGGFISPIIEVILISLLPYCGPNHVENVFCDFPPLISLACTETKLYILVEFVVSAFIILLSFAFVLLSYIRIILVIVKIKSKVGRQKTFSTCGAHLIVVTLFFGSIGFMYLRIAKSDSVDYDRAVGLTYAVFTPLANPFIYGLRNHEIKKCLHRYVQSQLFHTLISKYLKCRH
ncbi:PREDICTED: olfactory receptor 6N1-like [Nanorana parkeri]|uniref:olfactory receptor 6N1-like n=1 Tax=Nanorana parkeri TaxID=125878 RepID=UPI00085496E2|nr:PREDICTED: olfactory receptor 6N1-like [Nanorana parkeri]